MLIMIADDELVSRAKADRIIVGLGHETIAVDDGVQAWRAWRQRRPRVVITDWMMPGLDGLELTRRIRAEEGSRYTYIIMITSRERVEDVNQAMEAGVDDFLSKPFTPLELSARLRPAARLLNAQTREVVIFSMAKLAESRDPETGNHLERIRHYCRSLGAALARSDQAPPELDDDFLDNIFATSPLHDIGKIGIPDSVLLKPSQLSPREFEIMTNHCRIGYQTLHDALAHFPGEDYLRMSAEIALYHHEKYDGGGYPDGLTGTAIPLSARIVALADVYDALISKRVYKSAYPREVAAAVIIEGRESHFDPMVVDAFLECEEEFQDIAGRYAAD